MIFFLKHEEKHEENQKLEEKHFNNIFIWQSVISRIVQEFLLRRISSKRQVKVFMIE
jgi:hypothetical protein